MDENLQPQNNPEAQNKGQVDTPPESPPTGNETPNQGPEVQTKTYTQVEYSQMQASLRKEAQQYKDAIKEHQGNVKSLESQASGLKAQIDVLTEEVNSPYTDDDDKTAAQKLREARLALVKTQGELAGERATFESEKDAHNTEAKEARAKQLAEKTGVDLDALLKCKDPLEMLELVVKAEKKESDGDTSGENLPRPPVGSGAPMPSWRDLSPEEKLRRGIEKK